MDEPLIPDPIILVDPAYERGYAEGIEAGITQAIEEIERLREALSAMTELFKATEAVAQFGLSESRKLHEALAVIYRAHEKAMDEGETWFVTDDTTVGYYICSVLGAPPEEKE